MFERSVFIPFNRNPIFLVRSKQELLITLHYGVGAILLQWLRRGIVRANPLIIALCELAARQGICWFDWTRIIRIPGIYLEIFERAGVSFLFAVR